MQQRPSSNIERVRHPAIEPLELSDLWSEGATLWEWSMRPEFIAVLTNTLVRWRRGGDAGPWNEPAPSCLSGFEAVFVTGGRLENGAARRALSELPFPVVFGKDPVFSCERGGFQLLRDRGLSGWVADLGKSRMKISAPDWRGVFPRDWVRLLPAGEVSKALVPAQRRRLREFIALNIQTARVESGALPEAMLFTLPTRLEEDGTPGASNYAGMRGDRMLLRDALELAGLPDLPLLVMNDAELAALGALADSQLAGFGKVLALTLGYGIGAALIQQAN